MKNPLYAGFLLLPCRGYFYIFAASFATSSDGIFVFAIIYPIKYLCPIYNLGLSLL